MPTVSLTQGLRKEYETLFNGCTVRPERLQTVEGFVASLVSHRAIYVNVSNELAVPWFFIAVIHHMEASQDFARHLHNGDPLSARTVQVPAGRPKNGAPPFSWEESAADALTIKGLSGMVDWSLAGTLYQIERYNGWGYRLYHPHVLSPYLWSFSNNYVSGKYVADGTWADGAISKQCGAAVLLRRMAEIGVAQFVDQPVPSPGGTPIVVPYSMMKPTDPAVVAAAMELQKWLNTFPGIFVKLDGVSGERTSDAFRSVTGRYLPGDPRG